KILSTPASINLTMAQMKQDERQFNRSFQPVAVLLEGKFASFFRGRLNMSPDTIKTIGYTDESPNTAMIVVSDGDVIANHVRASDRFTYPLGYDIYTQVQYGNKDFIVNCMNYLCGDKNLLTIRTKQLKLRLLDTKRANTYRTRLQLLNVALPIGIIILLGIILSWVRKEKYAK